MKIIITRTTIIVIMVKMFSYRITITAQMKAKMMVVVV